MPFNQRRLSLTVGHEPADQDCATKIISVLYSGIMPPYGKKRLGHVTKGHSLGLSFKNYRMRPLHKLLFGFPLVIFFKICLCLRSSATVVLGFRRYFLILVALIQWVSGLAGRRAPRTLPPSRYYGRWLPGRTGLGF